MGIVAEAIGPPSADEVETAARHGFEQVIAAVSGTCQLSGFFLHGLCMSRCVCDWSGDLGDGTEVGLVMEDHVFVGFRRRGDLVGRI